MERSVWTDERLDDMASGIDSQFGMLRAEMAGMRTDMAEMRTEFRADMAEMRTEFRAGMAEMRTEFRAEMAGMRTESRETRRDMFHGVIALFGSQIAIFAVLFAQSL